MRNTLLLACLLVLGYACKKGEASHSEAKAQVAPPVSAGSAYLALGDSISFGYSPLIEMNDENVRAKKFVGFPEIVAEKLGLNLTSLSCPGETTSSFLDSTIPDNGCHSGPDVFHNYLKTAYTIEQVSAAREFLLKHPETSLVTISLGGNDLLMLQDSCNKEANPSLCKISRLPQVALNLANNYVKIIHLLKKTDYKGAIVIVTQYATDYKDPLQQIGIMTVRNELIVLAGLSGVKIADGFEVMKGLAADVDGSVCRAEAIIKMPDGSCNAHPSLKGAEALAGAVIDAINK